MPAAPSASVFINCPFDKQYQPIFDAIVFCVVACGFEPRCTLELTDAGEVRIENIYRLIAQCNDSVHDISRTEVGDQPYRLPRFNMPLELGIFLGAKRTRRNMGSILSKHSNSGNPNTFCSVPKMHWRSDTWLSVGVAPSTGRQLSPIAGNNSDY